MSKYRIVEIIDNSRQEREEREHIEIKPIVKYEVQKLYSGWFYSSWSTQSTFDNMDKAIREIEDLSGKYITKTIHEVDLG